MPSSAGSRTCRPPEMATFEAVGYAKFTGRLGVCAATSGPGAIHLLNGLYDAKLDHVAVVGDRRADQSQRDGRFLPAGGLDRGDEDRWGVVKQGVKTKLQAWDGAD